MNSHSRPLQEGERIVTLDMMRGLALLGILIANSLHFQYGLFVSDIHQLYPLGIVDHIAEGFILVFAQASFYTLFSFLFGYGMAFLKERLEQRDLRFGVVYFRRTFILLIVGFIHGVFIWDGDILFVYALTAFILFFFLKLKERGLLIWSFLLLFLMALSIASPEDDSFSLDDQLLQYSIEEKEVLMSGSYSEVVHFRFTSDPLGLGWAGDMIINATAMVSVLGMFLLGAFVARKKWLLDVASNRPLFKRVWWITLLIGFPCKIAYLFIDNYAYEMLHTTVGGPLVAMFYASSIALLATNERGRKLLEPLSNVGRLSLTNYLLQSIIFTTLFYGYGLGLYSSIGTFMGLLLVFLFFTLQLLASKWWLNRFYIGPFEWFWRWGTYLSIPKIRRDK
ncbi:DUF418 domain-containing protein [Halalkalibacter okhensis]|uniref:DUF418 domain-containing protein n=1 Tax=Halalkalibacter okhensis TaxID=333138 RepID=A0A0B0IE80_9BACI|nr:DUF418 domain-containing protein [Halalkalibacter okhensis]KHF39197.1 hypothetical protein LQ50_16760 [Halalkalibacter okhensis]